MSQLTFAEALEVLVALRDQTSATSSDEHLAFLNFCLANVSRSSGQFLQDLWVAYELRSMRGGFFVEFGASDGLSGSNSWFLERELGWKGILCEPGRVWYPRLRTNRAGPIDDRCVWSRSGQQVTFNEPSISVHATIDSYADADMHAETRRDGRRYLVDTVSLNDLLAHWDAPRRIDYLSIDTEGSELDILTAFDFEARDVRLITVEHNFSPARQPLFDLLSVKGYRRRFEKLSNVDDWYVKA